MRDMGNWDILVVGSGLVGSVLALALARIGFSIALIDQEIAEAKVLPAYDGRASAIAHGSKQVLSGIGLWQGPTGLGHHASPIFDIRVADGHPLYDISPFFLHYDHADLGDDPLGYIVENRRMRQCLVTALRAEPLISVFSPYTVVNISAEKGRAVLEMQHGISEDLLAICAPLCLAADGKFSRLRDLVGIKSVGWSYDQTALVCTVTHNKPHQGVAVELFLPSGPFAMLPMTENRSNIVWSEKSHLAKYYNKLTERDYLEEIKKRFGSWLGDISLVGPRFSYSLSLHHADQYIADRFALIGDAAHSIHPIAGQGLNMGLRDVAALAEVLVDARRLGLDIGTHDVLEKYQRWRRFDNVVLAAVTDNLTRLFSNDNIPLRLVRDIGLATVNHLPPVKKFLMRHAMGGIGDLPRLLRGEVL